MARDRDSHEVHASPGRIAEPATGPAPPRRRWRRPERGVEWPQAMSGRTSGAPRPRLEGGTGGISGRRRCATKIRRRPTDEGRDDRDLRRERVGHLRLASEQRVPQSFRGRAAAKRAGERRADGHGHPGETPELADILAAELMVAHGTSDARDDEIARHFQRSRDDARTLQPHSLSTLREGRGRSTDLSHRSARYLRRRRARIVRPFRSLSRCRA